MRQAHASSLPIPVLVVTIVFGVALIVVVVSALAPRRVTTYIPRETSAARPGREDTVTIDARDPDHWRFFAFGRGVLQPPDTAGWDLGIRRFDVISSGTAARLDVPPSSPPFDSVTAAPATGYLPTRFARDTVNAALVHWYRYDFFSHLLRPGGRVYVLHTRSGSYIKLEFLGYYCPGPSAGCVTFRYVASLMPLESRRFR